MERLSRKRLEGFTETIMTLLKNEGYVNVLSNADSEPDRTNLTERGTVRPTNFMLRHTNFS